MIVAMDDPRLLVVDDDLRLRDLLERYLGGQGFQVRGVASLAAMRSALDAAHVDLVVLDLMLPDGDGLSACRELRTRSKVPIIMVTAKGSEIDTVVGLEIGADDYVTKPYRLRELVARTRPSTAQARVKPWQSGARRPVRAATFAPRWRCAS